ncbi:50S ribosomal protein L3 [Candidatus Altiarchaeota archaeon]
MAKINKPRAGSLQYVPRKRAKNIKARIRSWPDASDAKILGYTAYKAGMTHVLAMDETKNSPTNGMEVALPVTILEAPPMKIVGVRIYNTAYNGLEVVKDIWVEDEGGKKKGSKPKDPKTKESKPRIKPEKQFAEIAKEIGKVGDIRLIASTQPALTGTAKKKPDVMELGLGGEVQAKLDYAVGMLGKDITINDVFSEKEFVDVTSVTKGKGFQGVVKRYGVKKQSHKASKKRRHLGTGGSWKPARKLWMEPQPGQTGFHARTEYSKQILKIGEDGNEVTPAGGFMRYGQIAGDYVMLYGSVPGSVKRIIRLSTPRRGHSDNQYTIKNIDLTSKQGM